MLRIISIVKKGRVKNIVWFFFENVLNIMEKKIKYRRKIIRRSFIYSKNIYRKQSVFKQEFFNNLKKACNNVPQKNLQMKIILYKCARMRV